MHNAQIVLPLTKMGILQKFLYNSLINHFVAIEYMSSIDLQQFLPYRLSILAKRISGSLSKVYAQQFDISIPEWRILVWLQQQPKLSAKAICENTQMDKTLVSRMISQLEKRKLVVRKVDKNDSRSYQLSLTTKGKALVDKIIPEATRWENQLIAPLSAAEYDNLFRLIDAMEKQLDTMP